MQARQAAADGIRGQRRDGHDYMASGETRRRRDQTQKAPTGLFLGKGIDEAPVGGGISASIKDDDADADEIDFTEDRFADDEENMVFEEDDETKEAGERIKKEQMAANIFDLKVDKDYDKEEEIVRKQKDVHKKLGKHVRNALMEREQNFIDDSDEDPDASEVWRSSSDDELIADESLGFLPRFHGNRVKKSC